MISRQMELRFETQPGMRPLRQRKSRSTCAHWWFEKMRGVVDHAQDWPSARPPVRPSHVPAPQAEPVPPAPGMATRTAPWTRLRKKSTAPAAPGGYRWQFSRTHRLVWE